MKKKSSIKKFRAFIKKLNIIYYWDIYEDFRKIDKKLLIDKCPESTVQEVLENTSSNIHPQQFTDFYDKNKNEIYEGDMISLNENNNYIVEYYKGSYILKNINTDEFIWFHDIKDTDILENQGSTFE